MFSRGDQIVYIPDHANGNVLHPDCEFGFVSSKHPERDAYFCRFWRRNEPGVMRTTNCSELAYTRNLRSHTSVSQNVVDEAIERYL